MKARICGALPQNETIRALKPEVIYINSLLGPLLAKINKDNKTAGRAIQNQFVQEKCQF
jgi:hypothetical protein